MKKRFHSLEIHVLGICVSLLMDSSPSNEFHFFFSLSLFFFFGRGTLLNLVV